MNNNNNNNIKLEKKQDLKKYKIIMYNV